MMHLVISTTLLLLAPFIYFAAARFQRIWRILDKTIVAVVTSLVVLHLLPESIRQLGYSAVGLAFLGLFMPSLLERLWSRGARSIHYLSVGLALTGLVVHGVMDGAALALPETVAMPSNRLLQLAVVLHRLPAALFIWSVFYPRRGTVFAGSILGVLGVATLSGYAGAEAVLSLMRSDGGEGLYLFQAVVAGSLLHIAFDRHDPHNPAAAPGEGGKDDHHHHGHRH